MESVKKLQGWLNGLLSIIALLVAFFFGAWTVHYKTFPYPIIEWAYSEFSTQQPHASTYHRHKKSLFQALPVQKHDLVLIGDSLTDWGNWHELLPGISIANRGIAGDTTKLVLARLDTAISSGADVAFIMLGINDLRQRRTVEDTFSNYVSIINTLVDNDISVVIQSTLYVGKSKNKTNEKVRQLNIKLLDFSQQSPNVSYIDINNILAPSGELSPLYSKDDLHLNGDGYLAWSKSLKNFLNLANS